MEHETDVERALVEEAQGRVDEKRHVVVEDLDNADAGKGARRIVSPDLRPARLTAGDEGEAFCQQAGELGCIVTLEIVAGGAGEDSAAETREIGGCLVFFRRADHAVDQRSDRVRLPPLT